MVGVHVGEFRVDEEADLVLAALLLLADVRGDDALSLLAQARVAVHLRGREGARQVTYVWAAK